VLLSLMTLLFYMSLPMLLLLVIPYFCVYGALALTYSFFRFNTCFEGIIALFFLLVFSILGLMIGFALNTIMIPVALLVIPLYVPIMLYKIYERRNKNIEAARARLRNDF